MAYKNNKLYVFNSDGYVKILDFSGDSDNEIVEGNPYRDHRFQFVLQRGERELKKRMAVTNSGEVLIVVSVRASHEKRLFYIFKMNVESGDWERVDTLGGEVLIFGHGVTVRSPIKEINGEGIKSDSICFISYDLWPDLGRPVCEVFDLATSRVTWPKLLDDSFLKSLWFVPGYA